MMGYRSLEDHRREQSGRYSPRGGGAPNNATACEVRWADLPLCCPLPHMTLWNSHPGIYLPIHKSGREQCPYCGTIYVLLPPAPGERAPFSAVTRKWNRYITRRWTPSYTRAKMTITSWEPSARSATHPKEAMDSEAASLERKRIALLLDRDGPTATRDWVSRTRDIYMAAVASPRGHASSAQYRPLFQASIDVFSAWLREDGSR